MSLFRFEGWRAEVSSEGGGRYRIDAGGRAASIRLLAWEDGLLSFEGEGRVVAAAVDVFPDAVEVTLDGRRTVFPREGAAGAGRGGGTAGAGLGPVRAEVPGKVLEVRVAEGQVVAAGEVLLVVEAMKMEHPLRSSVPARVRRVRAAAGGQIAAGDVLLELEAPE